MNAPPITVTGGAGGVVARTDEMVCTARRFATVAHDVLGAAFAMHAYLLDPALAGSALLDPVGYALFEADLLAALDAPGGLTWAGSRAETLDVELRAAAAAYLAVDRLQTATADAVRGVMDLGPAVAAGGAALAGPGGLRAAGQAVVARDPELADTLVDALGVPATIAALAATLPDGHGVVRHPGVDGSGVAGRPPRGLTDIVGDLAQRNGDAHHGEIDVRILTMPDGRRRAIVDITGTKSWDPLPTHDVTSLTTNGRALVGLPTAYEGGVLAAMRQAGVRADDDVMLVGHSEGGMVAVTAARDAAASGAFQVTHVVTAGSPVGRTVGDLPRSVQVLALENARDVVPHLDGMANPDDPNVTTVSAADGNGTVVDDHDITDAYLPIAAAAQGSDERSVRAFLDSAGDYFRAVSVVTHTYQIERRY